MNYDFLCDVFRATGEYRALKSSLQSPVYGKRYPYSINGISEGSEYIFLTCLCEDCSVSGSPVTVVFPDQKEAMDLNGLLRSVGVDSVFYPKRDYCFLNIVSSHDYEGIRLEILTALCGLSDRKIQVICTTPDALLQIAPPPEFLRNSAIRIDASTAIDTEKFTSLLVSAGYARVELVESVGQFAVRGGIIDVYPPEGSAVRIELFGDEIDRMGYFDTDTQRFTEMLEGSLTIAPVREIILSDSKRNEIISLIEKHLRRLDSAASDGMVENARRELRKEIEDFRNMAEINFGDKYLPVIYPEAPSLLDYVTGPLVICDTNGCREKTEADGKLLLQSVNEAVDAYVLPAQKGSSYSRDFEELYSRQSGPTLFVDTLPRNLPGLRSENTYLWNIRHVSSYDGNFSRLAEDVLKYTENRYLCQVICATETEKTGIMQALSDMNLTVVSDNGLNLRDIKPHDGRLPVVFSVGQFTSGYEIAKPKFALMNFSRQNSRPSKNKVPIIRKKKRLKATEAIMSYADLNVGDIVVHDAYGVGQYLGLETLTVAGSTRDYVSIKYAGTDKLFIPVDQLDHVSKYIGSADVENIRLSKMGGAEWQRAKSKAKASTKEMAKELIELYARRRRTAGIAFDPDDAMMRDFASEFEYEETDGQLQAIEDIRRDMERPYPMDRLLCGDVGYGKTEVAIRAAFKAVMSGKQVAVLVPTTILAYQHLQTFQSRMRSFPVRVDMLSRFRSTKEQQLSLRKLARGETDIIIGTHRIISKDIEFKDLGLIIIDEEQRFGVAQKEKLKKLAVNADVLTLTATPIPRTLNMSMGGIVDMSILEDAPGLRSPVQTYVMEYDEMVINEAIRRELRRGGQVFYMYNRIEEIYHIADRLKNDIPEARIAVAHGRMDKDDIEEVWSMLLRREIDILVCTTIIETGVDVPTANTLIIENADRYGLAQLHQIRGRVGRSSVRAFAYLTYRKGKEISEIAQKRLSALREYAEFGAGFRIALRDLEIRGAGNLLGAEQHGHLNAVGYDLYMKLLEEAVIEEKGEPLKKRAEDCVVDIKCDAYLTKSYIASAPQRMDMYKRIALIDTEEDYDDLIDEMCDRYGEPNSQAVNLCRIARIRALGRQASIKKITQNDGYFHFYTKNINARAIQELNRKHPALGFRVSLGQDPFISVKYSSNIRNTEFLLDLLKEYCRYCEEESPKTEAEN